LFEPTEEPGSEDAYIWILINTGRSIPQYVSINCSPKHSEGVLRYRRKRTLLDHIPYGVLTQMASHTHTHTHAHAHTDTSVSSLIVSQTLQTRKKIIRPTRTCGKPSSWRAVSPIKWH